MYGGYVSLTTPPEPIPPEVADLLVLEDNLGIDTGVPGMLDSSTFAQDFAVAQANANSMTPTPTDPQFPRSGTQGIGVSTQPMQLPEPSSSSRPGGSSPSLELSSPSGANTDSLGPQTLPRVTTPARSVSVDMSHNYPTTPGSFQMPQPQGIAGSDGSAGSQFDSGPGNSADFSTPPSAMDVPQTELTEQVSMSINDQAPANAAAQVNAGTQPDAGTQAEAASEFAGDNLGLVNAFEAADRQYQADQLREALATLSVFYDTPNISPSQREGLYGRLDPLAREVIYSSRHLLETPHRVGSNETLMEIAQSYNVPWQLLANINAINDPLVIVPGTELKVVRGPFNARVDVANQELTLFLGDLYAGRFPIAIGNEPAPKAGTFTVQDKQTKRTFYDRAGTAVPAGDPNNPYGGVWIDLGSQLCIHGSPSASSPTDRGCISLAANYADDLFGILSQGSSVTIRR
ncbi:MAG: LysM peptidoglycan-binding domain-containing protein [Pirellulaceae bacterium]|nr:LysM peptidoglycan-binding domain-containing protein [Pirellulaceae bacterium]